MNGRFVLKASGDEFMFNLKAANGEIIFTSENYVAKTGATNGIEAVRTNAPVDARYLKKTSTDRQHYFVLTGRNGEPLGRSEMYTTAAAMDNGIASVKANAPTAVVKDRTGQR